MKDLRKCKYDVETIREIEKDVNPALIDFLVRTRGDELNCENPAEPESEFCIFHDPEAWKNRGNEVKRRFDKLLEDGRRSFIGYHLTNVYLRHKSFSEAVDFSLTKFHVELWRTDFTGAEFQKANFVGANFEGSVRFNHAKFQYANFYHAEFREALFQSSESFFSFFKVLLP